MTSPTPRARFHSTHWIWLPGEPSPRNAVAEFRHNFHASQALAGAPRGHTRQNDAPQ